MSDKPFFSDNSLFNIAHKINRTELLEFIKKNSPISIWDISKKLEINRNALYFILRDFQFAGLIKTRIKNNHQNRAIRLVYYNKKRVENENS